MENKSDSLATAEVAAIAAISTALGFPVPPVFARNVLAATSALVVAAIAVPTAWLEGLALGISTTAKARARVTAGTVPAVLSSIAEDDELRARATAYLGGKMLREQANREAVVQQAVEQLKAEGAHQPDPPDSPAPIDEDWLNIFGKLAESRSDATMQTYFARILAGEIRRPGTFSPATLEVLSRMSKGDAESFQELCALVSAFSAPEGANVELVGLSAFVNAEPYGSPGDNKLAPVGFAYPRLCTLQEAGLVQFDLTAWRQLSPAMFIALKLRVGSTTLRFSPTAETNATDIKKVKCVNLTRAGAELLRIAHVRTNHQYVDKVVSWAEETLKLKLASRDEAPSRTAGAG